MKLTQKMESFCVNYFQTGNATESAIKAGYSKKTARVIASINLTKINIINRIQELRDAVASAKIMDVKERMEVLSEIGRGKLTDFVTCGPDRDLVDVGPDSPNSRALQEVTSRTEVDKDGAGAAVVTRVKLHDPVKAINELNKMDGAYGEAPAQGNTVINIGQVNIDAREKLLGLLNRLALRAGEAEDDRESEPTGSGGSSL